MNLFYFLRFTRLKEGVVNVSRRKEAPGYFRQS